MCKNSQQKGSRKHEQLWEKKTSNRTTEFTKLKYLDTYKLQFSVHYGHLQLKQRPYLSCKWPAMKKEIFEYQTTPKKYIKENMFSGKQRGNAAWVYIDLWNYSREETDLKRLLRIKLVLTWHSNPELWSSSVRISFLYIEERKTKAFLSD